MARSATAGFRPLGSPAGAHWRGEIAQRWQALPPALRSPRSLSMAALALALVLLLAFHQVLAQAVQRAEARRVAWSNNAYAMTRCASLPKPELRDTCRSRALAGIMPPEPPLDNERVARLN